MLETAGNDVVRADQQSFAFGNGGGGAGTKVRQKPFDDFGKSNLFLALMPERDVAHRAVGIGRDAVRRHDLSAGPRPQDIMHVSLNGVGRYNGVPEETVFAVSAAMSTIRAMPFEVTFDRVSYFAGPNAVVLTNPVRSEEMMDLHVQIAKEMWAVGLTFTYNPRFLPHMTLVYDDKPIPEQLLAEPVTWTAREFVLVRSIIGKSRYEFLDRWPLLGE